MCFSGERKSDDSLTESECFRRMQRPNRNVWLILDDVHKPAYRAAAQGVLDELGLEWFSLREWTRDPLTRYAWLVIR